MSNKLNQILYLSKFAVQSRIKKEYRKPLLCSFKITGNCNLKCVHCPFWRDGSKNSIDLPGSPNAPGPPCLPNSPGPPNLPFSSSSIGSQNSQSLTNFRGPLLSHGSTNPLDFENVVRILDHLYSEGVRIMIFEGGEPLLWKDDKKAKGINDVIEYAKKLFFFTGVTTNGTMDIGSLRPDIFFISIDGLAETHNRLRGGSFDAIMKNIEKNHSSRKIVANICISSENASEIEELVKFLNGKVYGITIQFFYPYESVENIKIGNREKSELLDKLIGLKRQGLRLLNSISCMKMMMNNTWKCDDFLVANVEQDGRISCGCYLKNKTPKVLCRDCGFTVHCEISLAYRFNIDAIKSAAGIFWG